MVDFVTAAAAFVKAAEASAQTGLVVKVMTDASDEASAAIVIASTAGAILDLLRNTNTGSPALMNAVIDSTIQVINLIDAEDQHKEICINGLEELRSHSNKQVWPTTEPEQYENSNDEDAPENDNDFWSGLLGR